MATAEGFDLTHGKQFTLFTHMGPNPWKITFLLHELGLGDQYHGILLEGDEVREPRFTKYNPNGRAPALIDHANNDFAIWESGAIMEYIVQKYDTEHKFSFESFEERMEALQYLMLQMSGQGPIWGQLGWFLIYHNEKIPSAIERYINQILRLLGVLENILSTRRFLVSNKYSYVDIAFTPWFLILEWCITDRDVKELADWRDRFPNIARWQEEILNRPAIKQAMEDKNASLKSNVNA